MLSHLNPPNKCFHHHEPKPKILFLITNVHELWVKLTVTSKRCSISSYAWLQRTQNIVCYAELPHLASLRKRIKLFFSIASIYFFYTAHANKMVSLHEVKTLSRNNSHHWEKLVEIKYAHIRKAFLKYILMSKERCVIYICYIFSFSIFCLRVSIFTQKPDIELQRSASRAY